MRLSIGRQTRSTQAVCDSSSKALRAGAMSACFIAFGQRHQLVRVNEAPLCVANGQRRLSKRLHAAQCQPGFVVFLRVLLRRLQRRKIGWNAESQPGNRQVGLQPG